MIALTFQHTIPLTKADSDSFNWSNFNVAHSAGQRLTDDNLRLPNAYEPSLGLLYAVPVMPLAPTLPLASGLPASRGGEQSG